MAAGRDDGGGRPLCADPGDVFGWPKTFCRTSCLSPNMILPRALPNTTYEADEEHLAATTLPGSAYSDPAVLQSEFQRIFARDWLCVGREEQIPEHGGFFTRSLGTESVLVVRGKDGEARAFHNVCRHRGTRIVDRESGTTLKSVACRYHAWTYSTEGGLVGAPHTEDLVDFRKEDFGLFPVRLERWGGLLWMNLDPEAPPLHRDFGEFFTRFDRFSLADLRMGARKVYEVDANWKILIENYSECYHCAPVHPDLNRITHYTTGANDAFMARGDGRAKFGGGYMTFNKDYQSMTWTGYTNRPPLEAMTEEDRRRIYYFVLFPNLFFSLHPDFLMVHTVWPASPSHSRIECEWYFDSRTMARDDFDASDAVDLWDLINRQDWSVCEDTQRGVSSRRWTGGRLSNQERMVHDFDKYYTWRMRDV